MLLLSDTHTGYVGIYFSKLFIKKKWTESPIDQYMENHIFADDENISLVTHNHNNNDDNYNNYDDYNTAMQDRSIKTFKSFDKQPISAFELRENEIKILSC